MSSLTKHTFLLIIIHFVTDNVQESLQDAIIFIFSRVNYFIAAGASTGDIQKNNIHY